MTMTNQIYRTVCEEDIVITKLTNRSKRHTVKTIIVALLVIQCIIFWANIIISKVNQYQMLNNSKELILSDKKLSCTDTQDIFCGKFNNINQSDVESFYTTITSYCPNKIFPIKQMELSERECLPCEYNIHTCGPLCMNYSFC